MLAFPDHKKIWKIAAGPYHSLFLTTDNELYVAGERYHYDNNGDESNVLHKVALQGNVILKEIAGGWNLTVGITDCDRVILFASSNIGEMVDDVKKGQFFVENVSGKTRVAVTNGGAILWLGTMNKIKKAFPLVQAWKRFYDLEIKIK
jgi:alpha-tubulin suppressor-like RCC1 family protein